MIFILVLLFVFNGQVVFEKSAYKTEAECMTAGETKIAELAKDPKFDAGLYAKCLALEGPAVKS